MGYDLIPSSPGARPQRSGPPSKLLANLIRVANERPGESVRIADSASKETCRVLAFKLGHGERAINGRPAGTWEFTHGPVEGTPDLYGVWATFTPPAPLP